MTLLCKLETIPDGNAVGMVAEVAGKKRNIFVVRQGQSVCGYLNWCPHNQVLIDQIPGQFFNHDKTYLQCSKHGALFRVADGFCIKGPCEGEYLKALNVEFEITGLSIPDIDGRPWVGPSIEELVEVYPDGFFFVTRFPNRLFYDVVGQHLRVNIVPISKKLSYHNFFFIEPL